MNLSTRLRAAARPAAIHLAFSVLVGLLAAGVVFGLWYPRPYDRIAGGQELLKLLISVDVVIGPLLTLVVWNRAKPARELVRDLSLIGVVQLAALGYGMSVVFAARPALLAFEGNRFRVVTAVEVPAEQLGEAADGLGRLSLTGPKLVGVRLAQPGDADYLVSVQQSLAGLHPALRPQRWLPYEQQREQVVASAKPLGPLKLRRPADAPRIDAAIAAAGLPEDALAYVPMQSRTQADWIVLLDRRSAEPRAFAEVDGW